MNFAHSSAAEPFSQHHHLHPRRVPATSEEGQELESAVAAQEGFLHSCPNVCTKPKVPVPTFQCQVEEIIQCSMALKF